MYDRLCLLKIKDISLEVGTVVNACNHVFRDSARGIMFLDVVIPACWTLAHYFPVLQLNSCLKMEEGDGEGIIQTHIGNYMYILNYIN